MRTGIIVLLALCAALGAWAGCTNYLPSNRSVKELVDPDSGYYVHQLTSGEREKLNTDGGWTPEYCYIYDEPAARDHSYIVLKFDNDFSWEEITARFRAKCDESMYTVKLYAWDGNEWDYITQNEGGINPGIQTGDVTSYMASMYLMLLLQVYTGTGAEQFDVTLGDLDYE